MKVGVTGVVVALLDGLWMVKGLNRRSDNDQRDSGIQRERKGLDRPAVGQLYSDS